MEFRPFMSINEACTNTGLSKNFLREGIKNGSIPHIMIGKKYMINTELFLQKLKEDSKCIGHH